MAQTFVTITNRVFAQNIQSKDPKEKLENQQDIGKMKNNNVENLLNFSIASLPNGIEAQESQGQKALIFSDTLPAQGDWEILERWGVIPGGSADDLFRFCTLPKGWTKVPTSHSMWSALKDARGLVRAKVFYKAAFYDRDAHFNVVNRFTISEVYSCEDNLLHGKHYQVVDNGLDRVVFVKSPVNSAEFNGNLVAIQNHKLYCLQGKSLVFKSQISADIADRLVVLSKSEFYAKWHNKKRRQQDFLHAIKKLAEIDCETFISQLPTDDSIWKSNFDFPEIG